MSNEIKRTQQQTNEKIYVDQFTDGVLDPSKPMLGPICDGGQIIANTAPGCWGQHNPLGLCAADSNPLADLLPEYFCSARNELQV